MARTRLRPLRSAAYSGRVPDHHSITTAGDPRSADLARRQKRYVIMMSVRMICFVGVLLVPGWWKVAMVIGAVVLPYVAVIGVNQPDQRRSTATLIDPNTHGVDAGSQPELTGPGETIPGEIVEERSDTEEDPR